MTNGQSEHQRLIRRILRVNHAGECGAVHIYASQSKRAHQDFPDLKDWLEQTLDHEMTHRSRFLNAMPERGAKPCRLLSVWRWGGALLGSITSLTGRQGVLACTAAVERTVHRHLDEQINFLVRHDIALAGLISEIQKDEIEHLAHAENQLASLSFYDRLLSTAISVATETLIFVSTRGDSLFLSQKLKANI